MSIAKITNVAKARKDQGECEKCAVEIHAGDPYLHYTVGFRSTWKHVRCTKPSCFPRPSERESSKLSSVLATQESAQDSLSRMVLESDPDYSDVVGLVTGLVSEVADTAREVAEEYREAATDDNGTVFNTAADERADELEGVADELGWWEPSYSKPEDTQDPDEWFEELIAEAIDAIDQASI